MSRLSRQHSCKSGASNPELPFWHPNNSPGMYTWDQQINLSPAKSSRVGDICTYSKAPLISALFLKAFMVIHLSPAHLPTLPIDNFKIEVPISYQITYSRKGMALSLFSFLMRVPTV